MKKSSESSIETAESDVAVIGCTSNDQSSSISSILPDTFQDKKWFKTTSLLRSDPSLMTSKILILALKNHAPLHVIKFFLSLNPKAAGIPKEGPTPLQVAVQHNASKEVVKQLIEACPFALIVTTSAEWLDPLSYARRFRSSETDLIDLLSRPLGSWIHPKEKEEAERREARKAKPKAKIPISIPRVPFTKPASPPPPPPPLPAERQQQPAPGLSKEDRLELKNVKELCLTVMKGQKRLSREVNRVRENFEHNPFIGIDDEATPATNATAVVTPENFQVSMQHVQELEEKQKKNLRAHLIALDMKEQAMRSYVHRMENRVLESLEATKQDCIAEKDSFDELRGELQTAALRMDDFMGSLEDRMTHFERRLDHESRINTNFRSGLEHHLGVTADASQQEGLEILSIVESTPFVFATPYRVPVTDEDVPLCPREGPREKKEPASCLVWPRFLSRRRNPAPTLS